MNRLLILPVLLLTLLVGCVSDSFNYQRGLDAYDNGNFATALREWRPLAEQGIADAQFYLGQMYVKGEGVPQNDKTAIKWYRLAAKQGLASARFSLGVMYEKGKEVPQHYKTAVKWYRLAAERGNIQAQNNLGVMYGLGQGVIQDNVYAHMWTNIAASQGYKDASKKREVVAKRMTTSQIETAQKLARECVKKNYKGC